MRIKVGVMGSAGDTLSEGVADSLREKADELARELAERDCVVLTGGTTGLPHLVGGSAHRAGALHVGVSPAENAREHVERFGLPLADTDILIFTGFGLKGRNVVLVRSCDIVLVVRGAMGALNEFTIAYDEAHVVGCLTGTGGAADEAGRLMQTFDKKTSAQVFFDEDPRRLLDMCIAALKSSQNAED